MSMLPPLGASWTRFVDRSSTPDLVRGARVSEPVHRRKAIASMNTFTVNIFFMRTVLFNPPLIQKRSAFLFQNFHPCDSDLFSNNLVSNFSFFFVARPRMTMPVNRDHDPFGSFLLLPA